MSKRGWDGDGERQAGDYDAGWVSDASAASASSAGPGVMAGRKILQPKRMRGGRAPTPKPVTPLPQVQQAQPVSGNTQSFGFTFGSGGGSIAPENPGFSFGGQQSQAPQQSNGFNFGQQSQSQQQPQQQQQNGFNFNFNSGLQQQPSAPGFGAPKPSSGFQGSIFNIQSPTPTPAGFSTGSQNPFQSSTNMFGQPSSQPSSSFNFGGSQSAQTNAFGQPAAQSIGFGSNAQSTSAPSSFTNNEDNSMMDDIPSTSATFTFGSNAQANQPTTSTAPAPSSKPETTSIFNFGATSSQPKTSAETPLASTATAPVPTSGGFGATAPDATAPSKTPLFSFAPPKPFTPPTSSTKPESAISKEDSATNESGSFKPATANIFASAFGTPKAKENEVNAPATTNMFSSAFGKPATTTSTSTTPLFSTTNSAAPKGSGVENASTAMKPSLFGTPTVAASSEAATSATSQPSMPASKVPTFSFGSANSSSGINPDAAKPSLFAPPVPGTASKVEQKSLPAFGTIDIKPNSGSLSFKPAEVTQASPPKMTTSGLFSTSSSDLGTKSTASAPSLFSKNTTTNNQPSLFSVNTGNAAGGVSQPLFSVNQISAVPEPPKSLFGTKSTESVASPSKPLFGTLSTSAPSLFKPAASTEATSLKKSIFDTPPAASTFKPATAFPDTSTAAKVSLGAKFGGESAISNSTATPAFKPSQQQHQDISPGKSPFNFRPVGQKPQDSTVSTDPLPKPGPSPPVPEQDDMEFPEEASVNTDFDKPPTEHDIPEGFAAKWTTLRNGDLPTDEVVDILFHDWIKQLEVPEAAKTGMSMDQRDKLDWLWQHNSIDSAWEYHVQELGNKDRNLLEVFRIVLKLKDRVDRAHGKVWSKTDAMVNPKIFDERVIRKMAKQNIENWENGLRSTIKSLRKRKADGPVDTVDDIASTKRTKTNNSGRSIPEAKTLFQAPAMNDTAKAGSRRPPSVEDDKHVNNSQHSTAPSTTSSLFAPKTSSSTNSSAPSNFSSAKNTIAGSSSSPQRSKTSQLFANSVSKPVETMPLPSTTPSRSLFDRISRDSTGAPMREFSPTPLFSASDAQAPSGDEEDEDDEESDDEENDDEENDDEEEEDADKDDADEDPAENQADKDDVSEVYQNERDSAEDEVAESKPKATNIFAQSSVGAKAKEAVIGSGGDNTWKPDSPIRFSKDVSDSTTSAKPVLGFVPPGGMPKTSTTSNFSVSSQSSWQAPANPFGNFKNAAKDTSTEKKVDAAPSPPKFEMPKPPATTSTTPGFSVSTQNSWTAPANPFGNFKKAKQESDANASDPPAVTLTAPSPQRPAKSMFNLGGSTSPTVEPAKPLFSMSPNPASTTSQPSLFSNLGSTTTSKSIFDTSDSSSAPKKPLFEFTKTETTNAPSAPVANGWLDFTKGLHKSSSPAPSGASVFASLNTSLNPSRASSPAMSAVSTTAGDTDAEHKEDEDEAPKEAQLDLGNANAGEENEDLIFSVKSKAYEFYGKPGEKKEWVVRGVGELRILKNKETSKVRAVLRAENSAKVLLNAGLLSVAKYDLMSAKRVNFTVASSEGVPSRWFLQVGKEDDAKKLSQIFEENKAN